MNSRLRGRLLIEAVREAAIELARAGAVHYPAPEPALKPTLAEIRALATREPITLDTDTDELWSAAAISPHGHRHWGLGRTPGEAKALAWAHSYWSGGTSSVKVEISPDVPNRWTFELYPPPERRPQMLAISAHAIFEVVRFRISDATIDEIEEAIMQSLPYMGARH